MPEQSNNGSRKRSVGRPKLPLTPQEQHLAKLIAETGMGGIEAARVAFGWRCEPGSKQAQQARDLANSKRVKAEIKRIQSQFQKVEETKIELTQAGKINLKKIRDYAFDSLEKIRDNPTAKAQTRFNAIKLLQKLHDPGKDINLIWKWIDLCWRYQTAHCPACHKSFPLAKVQNKKLDEWRQRNNVSSSNINLPTVYDCRLELIKRADKRRLPHPGQKMALSAPERHAVGQAGARAGKSFVLALFALLAFLLPGVEIWILARIYDDARSEVEYIQKFLKSLFHPYEGLMVHTIHDKKTGELAMISKWGSELRVRSAKAKGSITGRALELACIAEPGWLEADLYEEIRARMSERLGRIIAFGTPKGTAGFIGRLTKMTGRDPKTGKIIRRTPKERLIASGCPWGNSMLVYTLDPKENPEYVKSEFDAARQELTDEEFASEFEGLGVAAEGAKFPYVKEEHLIKIPNHFFDRSCFVLGIDQGPINFAACLIAFDGKTVVPCWEYFNSDEKTMKKNLLELRKGVPKWIMKVGGSPENWKLTITDRDPQLDGILAEMDEEGLKWATEVVVRHRNNPKLQDNWRRETQEFINNLSRKNPSELLFHLSDSPALSQDEVAGAYLLHDQVMGCIDVLENRDLESRSDSRKGWQVSDPWRGDHCFSPDTEVLTYDGWKKIHDISIGEIVMSRNTNGEISWQRVTKTIKKNYNGYMLSYGTKYDGASFMVTPDHMMYTEDFKVKSNIKFIKAIDIANNNKFKYTYYKIPARSKARVPGKGLLKYYNFKDGVSFAYFLGFYLAEGCSSITRGRKYIHLDQKNRNILEKILESNNNYGSLYETDCGWRLSIRDTELYNLIGGNISNNKYIPRWFFNNANLAEHEQLFNGLMDGDGTWSQRKYDSTSERLVDDFQELISRLGVVSSKVQTEKCRLYNIIGRTCKCNSSYRVRYRNLLKNKSILILRPNKFYKIPYNDYVYCISVPPYNVIFTRYKGKTMWIGQCLDAWLMGMWTIHTGQLVMPVRISGVDNTDVWAEAKAAAAFDFAKNEKQELMGGKSLGNKEESLLFEEHFGKPFRSVYTGRGHYQDES